MNSDNIKVKTGDDKAHVTNIHTIPGSHIHTSFNVNDSGEVSGIHSTVKEQGQKIIITEKLVIKDK